MQKLSPDLYLSREEPKLLLQKSDFRAAWELFLHWAWIVGAFALVHVWPHVLTVLVALFILGGKQLACTILMHDASHFAVFSHKGLNNFVGR